MAAIAITAVFFMNFRNEKLISFVNEYIIKPEKEIIVKKEPVYIPEVQEVETEWYYFVATGYSANDPSQGTNDTTATGKKVCEGIIAVDPKIIPLGIKEQGMYQIICAFNCGRLTRPQFLIYLDQCFFFGLRKVFIKGILDAVFLIIWAEQFQEVGIIAESYRFQEYGEKKFPSPVYPDIGYILFICLKFYP